MNIEFKTIHTPPRVLSLRWTNRNGSRSLNHLLLNHLVRSLTFSRRRLGPGIESVGIVCEWSFIAN